MAGVEETRSGGARPQRGDARGSLTTEETAALLGGLAMFSELSREELQHLAEVAVPRNYEPGHVVFRSGDTGDTCYVVRSGAVRVTRRHSDGRSITLAELRSGQMFGELALFSGETRSATVEAIEPTTAVALLGSDVRRTMAGHPEIAVKMLGALADRLRDANERLTRQAFQTVAGRVASVLVNQVQALQAGGAPERDVLISATQSDIAQLAGTSRESASRFLASLERDGVVTCGRGKVLVHDPAALGNYVY